MVGNQEPLETGSPETLVEYDPYGFTSAETIDQSYGSVYLTITYEMKNGSEKTREYVVPVVMTKPLYELSGSVRYYCAIADAVDAYAERIPDDGSAHYNGHPARFRRSLCRRGGRERGTFLQL